MTLLSFLLKKKLAWKTLFCVCLTFNIVSGFWVSVVFSDLDIKFIRRWTHQNLYSGKGDFTWTNAMNYFEIHPKKQLDFVSSERYSVRILTKKLCILVGKTFKKFHFPLLEFEFNGLQPMTRIEKFTQTKKHTIKLNIRLKSFTNRFTAHPQKMSAELDWKLCENERFVFVRQNKKKRKLNGFLYWQKKSLIFDFP